jgi:hypothetical protein
LGTCINRGRSSIFCGLSKRIPAKTYFESFLKSP